MTPITINNKIISSDSPAYVVAEVGHNHMGSLETCIELFKEAKRCGADAVKLQKRNNRELFTKAVYNIPYENIHSYGKTYGEHREFLEFGYKEYYKLALIAHELKIDFFVTAFDISSANFLEKILQCDLCKIKIPAYKIASGGLTNMELIKHVATFNKSMIISTGGGTFEDIDRVYNYLSGRVEFALMHCVASYPNKPEEVNLHAIGAMISRYPEAVIGWSDHYNGICMAEAAFMMGARIIEKHFTLNHTWKGTDHALSLEPQGMETLCHDLKRLHEAMGSGSKRRLPSEEKPLHKMAQSVHAVRNIKAGEKLTEDNIALKTPADGLPAWKFEEALGKIAVCDLSTADILKEEDYE